VIIGAGFGGLAVTRALKGAPVAILLLDRQNYHAFWPLMYQVATAELEPQAIAFPVRGVLRGRRNVHFQVVNVERVDLEQQTVVTDHGTLAYDELVVAAGAANNFFGLCGVEEHGFGFKQLPEALALRNHVIACFEQAVTEQDPATIERLLTFVIVGGGPTGVELAGAFAELVRHVLRKDYPTLNFNQVRVMLVEMADRVLLAFPEELSGKAQRDLERMGVDVRLKTSVADYQNDVLQIKDGPAIPTKTVVWAAGIQGAALGGMLGVPLERGGRVRVTPELQLLDHPNVWVIGDISYLEGPDGRPYPQVATVAMQQGEHVARNLLHKLRGQPLAPFRYHNKGLLAQVGRRRAVARIWGRNFDGPVAWWLWLAVHIVYLIGVRNRLVVLLNWAWNYLTYERAARDHHGRPASLMLPHDNQASSCHMAARLA
jgi:NADH dehydrogenase